MGEKKVKKKKKEKTITLFLIGLFMIYAGGMLLYSILKNFLNIEFVDTVVLNTGIKLSGQTVELLLIAFFLVWGTTITSYCYWSLKK